MARRHAMASRQIACYCLLLTLSAFTTAHSQTQEWVRGVGGPGSEYGRFVEPTSDGGFAVAGTRSPSAGSSVEDFWVARFDSEGRLLWQKTYGTPGVPHTIFTFSATRDGGFMFGGFTGQQFSGTESALMFRIDSLGNVRWQYDVNYNSSDHWHLLIERKNGGYFFGGHTDSKDDPYGDMWLVRLDDDRNILWEKTYDRGTGEHAHAGVETSDGGLIMLGHTTEANYEKYWLVKVDSTGTMQWDKVISSGPVGHDSPYDIFETREGGYALVGGTSGTPTQNASRGWLVIVDSLGNTLTNRHFGNLSGSSFSWGGRQTRDGGFILAGHSNYLSNGSFDMYIVKTDSQGRLEWESTYGGSNYDYGFDIVEVTDGYIGVGLTRSATIVTGGEDDLMLVKIRQDVELPAAVRLVSPANGSTSFGQRASDTALTWASIFGSVAYHVQVATDAAFASLQADDTLGTQRTFGFTPSPGVRYWWRVRAANENGFGPFSPAWTFENASTSSVDHIGTMRRNFVAVVPNPATELAIVDADIELSGVVEISLYDARGTLVAALASEHMNAGSHRIPLDTRALASGVYMLRLTRDGRTLASTRLSVAH